MVVVLSVALLCGLIGFAVHTLWIVAIVVLALANVRQDRRCHGPGSVGRWSTERFS